MAIICCLLILSSFGLIAQTAEEEKPKNWALTGYAKSMQGLFSTSFPGIGSSVFTDNFLHNRLNFKWYPSDNITFRAEMRNRFFFGEFTRLLPGFKDNLKTSGNDVLNMQLLNIGDEVILHSILDRLYFEYSKDKLEIRLGRQRVNWGINTIWNPHDIFNAFSFTDFDYEERPGSDALRIKYYTGFTSSIEFAAKAFDDPDEIVAGFLFKLNKWNYDFQILTGWSYSDAVLGLGWAGSLKQVGFKGEASTFISTNDSIANSFTGTISFDYSFKKGIFLSAGMLYNASQNVNADLFSFELSARNLYPYKWSVITSVSYPFNPIISGNLALIYSPVDSHPLFFNPTLTYSIAQNVDINLVGQILFQKVVDNYESPTKVGYLRIKWSF